MKLYAIRNIETDVWFQTSSGKCVWHGSGHAKNAWLNAQPYRSRPKHFDDQTKWKVVPVVLMISEE